MSSIADSLSFISIIVVLFIIMDPVGNIPAYLNLVKGIDAGRQRYIVCREMLIALALMILFNYIGEFIFSLLDISDITVRLSSGVILFLTALRILFPASNSLRSNLPSGEPFITPLAVPLIAGPSLLATIMLFAHLEASQPLMLGAIIIAWLFALIVLLLAPLLKRYLGTNGLSAAERLMAMILVMLSIQRFLEGVQEFYNKL